MPSMDGPRVIAVQLSVLHEFSKTAADEIELVAGLGVRGDTHFGAAVQHRSRTRVDPSQPNLRQVHLMQAELFDELAEVGHAVVPGALGENITTRGLDLLELPTGSVLRIGRCALVAITGLRNPCQQIETFQAGLLKQVVSRAADGRVVRKAGVMAVVVLGGPVRTGDSIEVALPPGNPVPLERV